MGYFWSNTVWFVILGLSTIIEAVYTLYKAESRRRTFAFFLTIAGLGFVAETNLFLFFKAYNYYPMIIPGNTLHDGLFGNLFSQFSVAATGLLIAVFGLKFRYHIIFAAIYMVVEELFLFLGIYRHNWYQTWMTFGLLQAYFPLVKLMYARLNRPLNPLLKYLYFFLGLWPLHFGISVLPFMIIGYLLHTIYILTDPTSNQTLLVVANYIILFTIMYRVYFTKGRWAEKALAIVALLLISYLEHKLQLGYIKEGWFFPYTVIQITTTYLYFYFLDKLYQEPRRRWH